MALDLPPLFHGSSDVQAFASPGWRRHPSSVSSLSSGRSSLPCEVSGSNSRETRSNIHKIPLKSLLLTSGAALKLRQSHQRRHGRAAEVVRRGQSTSISPSTDQTDDCLRIGWRDGEEDRISTLYSPGSSRSADEEQENAVGESADPAGDAKVFSIAEDIAVVISGGPINTSIRPGTLIFFSGGGTGVLLAWKELVCAVYIQPEGKVPAPGETARCTDTGPFLTTKCGTDLVGRLVSALGAPLDGGTQGNVSDQLTFAEYKGMTERNSDYRPLLTGVIGIDFGVPVGRGQTMLMQGSNAEKDKEELWLDVMCVEAPLGKRRSIGITVCATLAEAMRLQQDLKERGSWDRSIIVVADSQLPGAGAVAINGALAIAEEVQKAGDDAIVQVSLEPLSRVSACLPACKSEQPSMDKPNARTSSRVVINVVQYLVSKLAVAAAMALAAARVRGRVDAVAPSRHLDEGHGHHHHHKDNDGEGIAAVSSTTPTLAPVTTAMSPQAAAMAANSTKSGGDVGIVVLSGAGDSVEWLTVCSSDASEPHKAGGCVYVKGPEPFEAGEPLRLGLTNDIGLAAVDINRTLLCRSGTSRNNPASCEVLTRSGEGVATKEAGRIQLSSTRSTDMVVEVMNSKESRYASCYITSTEQSSLLNCETLEVLDSTPKQIAQLAMGNENNRTNAVTEVKLAQVDVDKVASCWAYAKSTVSCTLLTASANATFQHGTVYQLSDLGAKKLAMVPINRNRAIACFAETSDVAAGACHMIQSAPNSTDFTIGELLAFRSNTNLLGNMALSPLSVNMALLCYSQESPDSATVRCNKIDASGQTMSMIPLQEQTEQPGVALSLARLDDNRTFFCVKDAGSRPYCRSLSVPPSVTAPEEKFAVMPQTSSSVARAQSLGTSVVATMLLVAVMSSVLAWRWLRRAGALQPRRWQSESEEAGAPPSDEEAME